MIRTIVRQGAGKKSSDERAATLTPTSIPLDVGKLQTMEGKLYLAAGPVARASSPRFGVRRQENSGEHRCAKSVVTPTASHIGGGLSTTSKPSGAGADLEPPQSGSAHLSLAALREMLQLRLAPRYRPRP